ncbi:AraC family transcriptional regulator [uncultured Shimia sp.]|uniref:AraC family transcriptional regulator n=1 Tax=uncultured Shimia sp. TaxID=573152 RepID=UPI0026073A3C|nr:AraC family transcriptional regulator [uncultured Shimia sp.]
MQQKKNERFLHVCSEIADELGDAKMGQLLRRVGVNPKQRAGADVTTLQEAQLLREACKAANDISFAARVGSTFRQAQTLTGYIAKSSKTLGNAIENSARFYALADPETNFQLTRTSNADVMKIESNNGALLRHHRFQEFLVFGLLARLRVLAGVDFFPERLCLQHEIGDHQKPFEKLAGCRVEFASDFTGIVFGPSTLDLPMAHYDPGLVDYLSELGANMMAAHGTHRDSYRAQVEKHLIKQLPGRILSADEVADKMAMSRRTLTRHLTTEGTGFREIVDGLRFDIAKTYLKDGLSISEIAFMLGYADHAAFSTAFSRWAGQSPRKFQKSIQGH